MKQNDLHWMRALGIALLWTAGQAAAQPSFSAVSGTTDFYNASVDQSCGSIAQAGPSGYQGCQGGTASITGNSGNQATTQVSRGVSGGTPALAMNGSLLAQPGLIQRQVDVQAFTQAGGLRVEYGAVSSNAGWADTLFLNGPADQLAQIRVNAVLRNFTSVNTTSAFHLSQASYPQLTSLAASSSYVRWNGNTIACHVHSEQARSQLGSLESTPNCAPFWVSTPFDWMDLQPSGDVVGSVVLAVAAGRHVLSAQDAFDGVVNAASKPFNSNFLSPTIQGLGFGQALGQFEFDVDVELLTPGFTLSSASGMFSAMGPEIDNDHAVPMPGTLPLALMGLALLGAARRNALRARTARS